VVPQPTGTVSHMCGVSDMKCDSICCFITFGWVEQLSYLSVWKCKGNIVLWGVKGARDFVFETNIHYRSFLARLNSHLKQRQICEYGKTVPCVCDGQHQTVQPYLHHAGVMESVFLMDPDDKKNRFLFSSKNCVIPV
jgi:hypothetical protein